MAWHKFILMRRAVEARLRNWRDTSDEIYMHRVAWLGISCESLVDANTVNARDKIESLR